MALKHWAQWLETAWWRGDRPVAWLQPLTHIYQAISGRHLQQRLARQQASGLPLIAVGNITAGGSGKTPFTLWLARELQRAGWRPVLLCRGDGGKASAPCWLDDRSLAAEVGDEAVLLHRLSRLPVMAARDRVLAAEMIAASGQGNIILLDDGFQYRQLARSCDVVLVPAAGIGNGGLIPAGPLREPVAALTRADLVIRSGEQPLPLSSEPITSGREWQWSAYPCALRDWRHQAETPPSTQVQLIAAIARPERLHASLQQLGYRADEQHLFRDHYRYRQTDIERFLRLSCPVTTAKDAVKLLPRWPADRSLWVIEQQYAAEPGLSDHILGLLPSLSV